MRTIDHDIWSFLAGSEIKKQSKHRAKVRATGAHFCRELISGVAQLSFHNPEFVLCYRAWAQDFQSGAPVRSIRHISYAKLFEAKARSKTDFNDFCAPKIF
jgi:hypothetical protein